jgi:glycerate dehydrogenase
MREIITVTDGYTLNPGDLDWSGLEALGTVRYYDRTAEQEVVARCQTSTVIVTNKTPITAQTMKACNDLKVIAVSATGYNIIDIDAAKKSGVIVCNVPGYGTDSVAQHTFALILELSNHVGLNSRSVARGEWSLIQDFCYTKASISELAGKTLGVIGYGMIGRKVADIGRAFGMNVIYARRPGSGDSQSVSVEKIFSQSDVITLHCPLTPSNIGFVNLALLKRMKRSAILINTARGQLINEHDLAMALSDGTLRAAGLDVLSKEPPPKESLLIGLSNCLITPHNAWYSLEARQRIMSITCMNVESALRGIPQNVVNH